MVKKGADWGGTRFPYPCGQLNDEGGDDQHPIHLPPSIQRSEYRVTLGNSNPVGLFRIDDGDEERELLPVPWILAIFN
jgi:hypothetical protein